MQGDMRMAGQTLSSGAEHIAPAQRAKIETALAGIESERDMRILYACEPGSRG